MTNVILKVFNKNMENNLKSKLVSFYQTLNIQEQHEVAIAVTEHINYADTNSELEIGKSLQMTLESLSFYDNVKDFLAQIGTELNEASYYFQLKDLYHKISRKENVFLYENVLHALLECLNAPTEEDRAIKVMNDLKLYDWIPEVKSFLFEHTNNPQTKTNMIAKGGLIEDVYSVVVKVDEGYLAFVHDKWFHMTKNGISATLLENHIQSDIERRKIILLEQALETATFNGDTIQFNIGEGTVIGINQSTGEILLNGDVAEEETTLESIYNSPVVSLLGKSYYPMMAECLANLKSFVLLDTVKKVSNVMNKRYECYLFNHEGQIYQYRIDSYQGNSIHKFESALAVIENVIHELGVDTTYFFETLLSDDLKKKAELDRKEVKLTEKLTNLEDAILKIKDQKKEILENKSIKLLHNTLLAERHRVNEEIKYVRNQKIKYLN